MKKLLVLIIGVFILIPLVSSANSNLADRLSGRILLQVEEKGEAWYIEPTTKERAFLGRPDDAFRIMRELGLGISEKDFKAFGQYAPKRLSGRILLRVEANGEAYYVNPVDLKMYFLGRPADAFQVMRNLGLGITNQNLEKVKVFAKYNEQKNIVNNAPSVNFLNQDKNKVVNDNDEEIDNNIKSINDLINILEAGIQDGSSVITNTRDKMKMFLNYYLVQSSGQQLISEVESYNFLRNKTIVLLIKMKDEFKALLGTGFNDSENIKSLFAQVESNFSQMQLIKEKVDRLIIINAEELGKASGDAVKQAENQIEKLEKVTEAARIINENIGKIDNNLSLVLIELDNKKLEIEAIKKQPVSANTIYYRLQQAYSEYDEIVSRYNDLLNFRNELVYLFEILNDYYFRNMPISTENLRLFDLWGITL